MKHVFVLPAVEQHGQVVSSASGLRVLYYVYYQVSHSLIVIQINDAQNSGRDSASNHLKLHRFEMKK